MLRIRKKQMQAFNQATIAAFEDEMVVHSQEFSPRLCEVIGEEQLRAALRKAIDRAGEYDFTLRGPVRLFVELMFLYGSDFHTDPQYPWISKILQGSDHEMTRAKQLRFKTIEYQEKVSGPDVANTRKCLEELSELAQQELTVSHDEFGTRVLSELNRVFPQKFEFTGEEGIRALIHEGRNVAREYRFPTVRGAVMVVILMFAFGHGCTEDPLYPWIARTLKDELIVNPAARSKRLEKKALTWLDHVLAASEEGATA